MSRILFIITQSEMGGAQRYLLEFAPYLVSRGHEVAIAAGEGDDELFSKIRNSKNEIRNKFKLYKIPNLVRSLNPIKDIAALFRIIKIIKEAKPNVLFLQSTKAGFLGSLAAKLYLILNTKYQIRVVYRIGGWSFRDPRTWWMNKILFAMEKISAPWKDIIVVNSEFDRQLGIKKRIVSEDKIVKIYNGIEPNSIKFLPREEAIKKIRNSKFEIRDKFKIQNKKNIKIIGTIANLYATKGLEYIIEAARILYNIQHTTYNIQFVVIGEGKERSKLEALIKKYNIEDRFFLVGRVPDASRYLKAFDVFILPSVKEGMPWVLLEAMTAETPIIATTVGAIPEIIENKKDGLLVPPRESEALAEKIKKFIENPELAKELPKNASKKLKQFSQDIMLQQSEGIINEPRNPTKE